MILCETCLQHVEQFRVKGHFEIIRALHPFGIDAGDGLLVFGALAVVVALMASPVYDPRMSHLSGNSHRGCPPAGRIGGFHWGLCRHDWGPAYIIQKERRARAMIIELHGGDFKKAQFIGNKRLRLRSGIFFFKHETVTCAHVASVENVAQETSKSFGGAVGKGIVGGLLLGPLGAVAGVLSGGNKSRVAFRCVLKDGRQFVGTTTQDGFAILLGMAATEPKPRRAVGRFLRTLFAR